MPTAIAFSSRPGTGKTTIARALAERHGMHWASVGEVLRAAMVGMETYESLFIDPFLRGLSRDDMHGRSPRDMMLDLGAWGRAIHPEYWLRRVMVRLPAETTGTIVENLMDDFEATFVRSWLGGPVVRPVRWAAVNREDRRMLLPVDIVVSNNRDAAEVADDVMDRAEIWSLRPVEERTGLSAVAR